MPIELPANVRELRTSIARASLIHSYRQRFSKEPPNSLINDPQQIKRAEREWHEHYALQIGLLSRVATQALSYFEQSHVAAVTGFMSSLITQSQLSGFMQANPYLQELVADTLQNVDSFRQLLTLFVQLPQIKS